MYVREAKLRCPDLEIVPYNFEAYEKVITDFVIWDQLCRRYLSCLQSFSHSGFYDTTL